MSTLLLSLARENPFPGLAVASLNPAVALSLVGLSLLLGVTISLLAWLQASEPQPSFAQTGLEKWRRSARDPSPIPLSDGAIH